MFWTGDTKAFKVIEGIPHDGKVIDVRFNAFNDKMDVLIESEEFDEIKEGTLTPVARIVLGSIDSKI